MAIIMMYVLPMLLGQTYDLGKEKPGLQIFPESVSDNVVQIEHYFTDSQYRMVENSDEIRDFLDVGGKLALKIKSGLVDISGEGSYLKDSSSKTNGLEIIVKVHFETVTKTIPTSTKPKSDWSLLSSKYLGTHYCRSITYGGDLLASIRITASDTYDLERIKGAINGGVNAGGGSFEANVKGKLDILKNDAQDRSSMEINYYASVPIPGVSYTIDGLLKLIDEFPNHVKKVNNGIGNPLRMELYPLSSLKVGYPDYLENRALKDELNDLEDHFDDLRKTRREMGMWLSSLPPAVPTVIQQKIETFSDKINKIYGVFMKTIADLDTAEGASTQPIKDALDAYKDKEYTMPEKYIRQFRSLQKEIYKEAAELKPKRGGAHYVRWGKNGCSSSSAEISLAGVMATSEVAQDGGSINYVCSAVNPDQIQPEEYFANYNFNMDSTDNHLLISPTRYRGNLNKYKSMFDKTIACANCRASHLTAVFMKAGDRTCPEKWTKEYEGYLMAPGKNHSKGQYICMDKDMEDPAGEVPFGTMDNSRLPEVQEVTVKCGSLPCEPYEELKPVPCVVCTI